VTGVAPRVRTLQLSLEPGLLDRGNVTAVTTHSIERVRAADLDELLGLMRAYCDFYEVSPTDEDLLAVARALIRDPEHEGVQLLARDASGRVAGFATAEHVALLRRIKAAFDPKGILNPGKLGS
jgi:FAD/FMN-containing dehydrogenase